MTKRVAILGGGVIGLCSAWHASMRGWKVVVVDRNPARRDGCSFGNSGMIVPSHFIPLAAPGMVALGLRWMWNPESPFYVRPRLSLDLLKWGYQFWKSANRGQIRRAAPLLRDLHLAGRAGYERLKLDLGDCFELNQHGLLMLCKTNHTLDEESKVADQANQLGVPAEVLNAQQTATLEPHIRMDVAGSVYFPQDCHLAPQRLMAALQDRLVESGVDFRWSTTATGLRSSGRKLEALETSTGSVAADAFVLAGGAWSASLVRDLGLKLPIQPGKGYSLTLGKPRQLPRLCAILTEARVAVTPMAGALRFGGTMEIGDATANISPRRVAGIVKSIPLYFPDFEPTDFAGVQPWSGLRPCSPDGLPYLGKPARLDNLIVATAHAMMGVSLAPITGQLVAELLDEKQPSVDLTLLNPDRFGGGL